MISNTLHFLFNLPRNSKLIILFLHDCFLLTIAYHLSLITHGFPIQFSYLSISLPLTTSLFFYFTNLYKDMTRFISQKTSSSIMIGITLSSIIFFISLFFNNLNFLFLAPLNFFFISIVFIFGSRFTSLQLYNSIVNKNRM